MRMYEVAENERRAMAGDLVEDGPQVEVAMATCEFGSYPQVGDYLPGPYGIRHVVEEPTGGWRLTVVTLVSADG